MKQFFTKFMMAAVLVMSTLSVYAQQLPDPGFEDWSGAKFDGNIQPKYWNGSNVSQVGQSYNFTTRETGRSGYAIKVANTFCGLGSIGQTSPGYFTLGTPWQYLPSVTQLNKATGGTDGGVSFSYCPDSMYVWIKRTGNNTSGENYSILFYSWKGTAKGTSYKGNTSDDCTSTSHTDEESDIRQALDANKCGTATKATQVAEGFFFEKKAYSNWTQIKVPIYYFNDEKPDKCNVIISSSGYPNFRASSNINEGNAIIADDIELIYSSKIDQLYIGGMEWGGFDPNSSEEQVYSVGHTTEVPEVYAKRGAGKIKNMAGTTVTLPGRKLTSSEFQITQKGAVDGAPMIIKVTSADGKSSRTYKIKMVQAASENAKLKSILVNDEPIENFNPDLTSYNVALPYGTTAAPVVSYVKAEDKQTVSVTQATSPTGKATISVTAADGKTKKTYTLNFSIAQLADNTLKGIKVNGEEIAGFSPTITSYRVDLPRGTTTVPTVEAISAYPAGAQTITHKAPSTVDGGTYTISVTTPGNSTAMVYRLNFRITASTNSKLKDLKMGDYITNFDPDRTTYYVTFPKGTTKQPEVTYTKGDAYQTVEITYGGVDGTTIITVTAASGDQTIYKIICETEKSTESRLNMIYLDGQPLAGFDPDQTEYTYQLAPGTVALPTITFDKKDDTQNVNITYGGLNGTTRISVTAGSGKTTVYKITFALELATNTTLDAIYLDGKLLEGYDPTILYYYITLPKTATQLPVITWDLHEASQVVISNNNKNLNGKTTLTVRAQSGASQVYTIQFHIDKDTINHLNMIYLDGEQLQGFHKDSLNYIDSLPVGVSKIPAITYDLAAESATARVLTQGNKRVIRVTAEDGSIREYSITFVIRKSESAFPKMINVGGEPLKNFDPRELEYTYMFDGDVAPEITVEKNGNQQVTILSPVRDGDATVIVAPEGGGDGNTYIIHLRLIPKTAVQLADIQLDGATMEGFDAAMLDYTITYSTDMPYATCTLLDADKQSVRTYRERNIVRFVVTNSEVADLMATYTLTFEQQLSDDATLKAIKLDGETIKDFRADSLNYAITLPAGSPLPEITYEPANDGQNIVFGQTGDKQFAITVRSEDGDYELVYTVSFEIEVFTSAELEGVTVDGEPLALEEGKYTYELTVDEGAELPTPEIVAGGGQSILIVNTSDTQQQIIVEAENGETKTYTLNYTPILSKDAQLEDILLDGVSMDGFNKETYAYTHELAWRTRVVPSITPIGATPNQVIEVHYGAVNAQTTITVTAANGVDKQTYTIDFPVIKSAKTALDDVQFEGVLEETFKFDSTQTDYTIILPYQTTAVPQITYYAAEPEQKIKYVNAPLGKTSQLVVTAENGAERTYNFTIKAALSDKPNKLDSLIINTNKISNEKRLLADDETDITIDLAYGTSQFEVGYVKSYDEQAVIVEPGGIFNPTKITVKANRGDEADKVYTITPKIETQNPAVLDSIIVNGKLIEGFDKNRFSYQVSVTGQPTIVAYAKKSLVTPDINNTKHWQKTITVDGYSNTYDVWIYYTNDVIPNSDFTDWTKAATYTSANKPTSWSTIPDVLGKHSGFGSFSPDELISRNGTSSVVHLTSKYSVPGGGYIPSFITLGTVTGSWGIAGASNFSVTGGISFKNSPDIMQVNAKISKVEENTQIVYSLSGEGGTKQLEWKETANSSSYKTYSYNLKDANAVISVPTTLNIILNSFHTVSGTNGAVWNGTPAEMYVDWVKFSYNNELSTIKVNGNEVAASSTTLTYTLPSSETIGVPQLDFIGQVTDQAQKVEWSDLDPRALTRQATITNYGEDGQSTEYKLTITRPKSKINTLSSIFVDGAPVNGWASDITEYEVQVPNGQMRLHDVQAFRGSELQTIVTEQTANQVKFTVKAEDNSVADQVYTVKFVEKKSKDVTLKDVVAPGLNYKADTKEYNLELNALPQIIPFVKQTDGQTVTLDGGKLHVVAEDGTTTADIIITCTPPETSTTGQFFDLQVEGLTIRDFDKDTYDYESQDPLYRAVTSFTRIDSLDVVWQTIQPNKITWLVKGSTENTYSLTYQPTVSDVETIAGILVNDDPLPGFDPALDAYDIDGNDPVRIQVLSHPGQTITAAISVEVITAAPGRQHRMPANIQGFRYTIDVTSEDGLHTMTYTINVLPKKSDDASLKMIRLNGADLEGFDADNLRYVVTQPAADPKLFEPKLPAVAYVANQSAQMIELETRQENDTTYHTIAVTSEDGFNNKTYELLITNEPSHNANITELMLDGEPLEDFDPARYQYSSWVNSLDDVEISYSAEDRFLTIEQERSGNTLTLHVVAQDKVTSHDYEVKVYPRQISTDASLANILLNEQPFTDYDPSLTPFTPMNSYYTIPLASNQTMPDVRALLNDPDQTMTINTSKQDTVEITVIAPDGVHQNTYVLFFKKQYSSNVALNKLEAGETPITLVPGQYDYTFALNVGEKEPRGITFELQDYDLQSSENELVEGMNWSVDVVAEDGTRQTYTVHFVETLSQNALLERITADYEDLEGFEANTFDYEITLPMGQRRLQDLTFYAGDEWQREQVIDTIDAGALRTTYLCHVLAEDSIHRATYSVTVNITPSNVDTLQQIYVGGTALEGFDPYRSAYTIELPKGTTELPEVELVKGDDYQRIDSASVGVGGVMTIIVTAENGNQRTYTILFAEELDHNATLAAINYGDKALTFDPEKTNYNISLPYGTTVVPVVTYTLANPVNQKAEMTVDGFTVTITVTAEDGTTQVTYTLNFTVEKSANANLASITIGEQPLDGFRADSVTYTIILPYGTTEMPAVTYQTEDEEAEAEDEITGESLVEGQTVTIIVTAPNGEDKLYYDIHFVVELCPINWLEDLLVNGSTIEGFDKDSTTYTIEYPVGSDSTVLFSKDAVTWKLADESEKVEINSETPAEIQVVVTAANQTTRVYTIRQVILRSSNSLLRDLTLNGRTIAGFDPETLEYTYLVAEGEVLPEVIGVADDDEAEVSVTMGVAGEVTKVFCIAADGSRTVYSILFEVSSLNNGLAPQANDVLLKQVSGSTTFAAYSLRMNTSIAIYDQYGHLMLNAAVPVCNPNDATISYDPSGREVLTDANGDAVYFELPAQGQVFFYLFYSDSQRIKSGKFFVQ